MAERKLMNFGFFDYAEGDPDDYSYTAAEFSDVIGAICGDGVNMRYGNHFDTTASGLTLTVASGAGWIGGHYGYNTASVTLSVDDAPVSGTRYDILALVLDEVNRQLVLKTINGTSNNYPTLVQGQELGLFKLQVSSNSIIVSDDIRVYNNGTSAAPIIFSTTEPVAIPGYIWLKPVS